METKLITKESVTASFEVTIPAADVDKTYNTVFRSLARQIKVPGFRPGKAPKGVILSRIGEEGLAHEVREALVDKHYPKAVKELELQPIHANITKGDEPTQGEDYSFEVTVDLIPEFDLPDLEEIIIDTEAQALTDDMVDEAIEQLRGENATHIPVDRAVEANDYIMIETLREGEEEAGSAMPIDLERTGEHLAEQLIGKSIGDELELDLSGGAAAAEETVEETTEASTEDADEEAEASSEEAETSDGAAEEKEDFQLPTLKVRISDVKEKEKPEANDEFAKILGMESWDQVEDAIRKNIQSELDRESFEAQRNEFIEKLVEETDFDLPAVLVNRRKVNLLENLAEDLKKQNGLTLDGYFKSLDEEGKRDEFDAELTESAETGVKRDLVLEKLLDAKGTELTKQEFDDALNYLAYREGMNVAKFKKERGQDWIENYRFLLSRDKTIRDIVREKLGLSEDSTEAAEEIAENIADEIEVEEAEDEKED